MGAYSKDINYCCQLVKTGFIIDKVRVKIKDRHEIAKETLLVTFDLLGQELNFKAGQFCRVTLLNPPYNDNRGNSRFFGFVTSPSEKGTFSILTRMGVSAFKKSLLEVPLGTEVEVGGIDGHIILPQDMNKLLVFVAGGIGIAPVMGILRFCHEQSWPYKITLVYSNENREWAAFLDELMGFAAGGQKFKLIATMTQDSQWRGEKRRINAEFIKDHFPEPDKNLYFITGTPRFVTAVFRELKEAGVAPVNIKMEIFTGY